MAFTVLALGDEHPDAMSALEQEIQTAIEERADMLKIGAGNQPAWSTSGVRATRWRANLILMRSWVAKLAFVDTSHPAPMSALNCFVKSDWSNYSNLSDLLTTAGHGSGWINIDTGGGTSNSANYLVSSQVFIDLWDQVTDVLGVLLKYQLSIQQTILAWPSGSGKRAGEDPTNSETAWDECVANTKVTTASENERVGWFGYFDSDFIVRMHGPQCKVRYNLSGLSGGTSYEFRYTVDEDSDYADNSDDSGMTGTIEFADSLGHTWSYDSTGFDNPLGSISMTSGITFGGNLDITLEITTSEPANAPWGEPPDEFGYGKYLRLYDDAGGGSTWNFRATVAAGSGLTYG